MPPPSGKHKSAAVVAATKIPMAKLNRWSDRKIILMRASDKKANGKGDARGFSLGRIYQIAIAHALTKLKIPAKDAMAMATKFTDEPQRGRELGKPFSTGQTLIVSRPDGSSPRVANLAPDGDLAALLTDEAVVLVNVNKIIAAVNLRIGSSIQ
jgi:hypothetical protein